MTFLSFAMPVSMLGVIWPDVRGHFSQTLGTLGLVSLVYGVSRMLTCASGRRLIGLFGTGPAFVAALGLLALSCSVLATAPNWRTFLAGVAGIGMTSGMLDSIGAVFITRLGDVGSAGLVHGSYGVGATLGPLVVAVMPTWRVALFVCSAVTVAAGALAYRTRNHWPPDEERHERAMSPEPIDRRAVLLSIGLFVCLVGIEVATGQWAHTYLTDHRRVSDRLAALGVAGFWGGITIGRLALSRPVVMAAVNRLGLATLAALAAALLAAMVITPPLIATGVLVGVGVALSPIIPTLFATTSRRVGLVHAQRLAGWQLLAANTGAITAPSLTGWLVDRIGPGTIAIVWFAVIAAGIPLLVADRRLVAKV